MFVRNMRVLLTDKPTAKGRRADPSWKAVNGRPGIAHSFSYAKREIDGEEVDPFVYWVREQHPTAFTPEGVGKVFTIPQPDYINVRLNPMKSDPVPCVVPMEAVSSAEPVEYYLKHAGTDVRERIPGAIKARTHNVTQGYVYTYDKLQGATLEALILVLDNVALMSPEELLRS